MVLERVRALVSKKKRRHKEGAFDLDLSYIRPNMIAMGFPASDLEGAYRNCIDDVQAFFDKHHKDHYRFYNLCSERTYPLDRFHGQFARFPFDDHSPPPLGLFYFFCRDVENFLAKADENVVAVHCKAGKGRTGVMISAYLLWAKEWTTPKEAMDFFGFSRTENQKGVTIPSQRRFVEYFFHTLKARDVSPRLPMAWVDAVTDSQRRILEEDDPPPPPPAEGGTDPTPDPTECADNDDPTVCASVLDFATLPGALDAAPDLWAASRRPVPKKAPRLLNHEWSRQNRLSVRGPGALPPPKIIALREIRLRYAPKSRCYKPIFTVRCADFEYRSEDHLDAKAFNATAVEILLPLPNLLLSEEVLVTFFAKRKLTGKKVKSFHFWFHCNYVDDNRLFLPKFDIDKACKDKKHVKFPAKFALDLRFTDVDV